MSKKYDITKVPGYLFTPTGKWKYCAELDYTDHGQGDR